MIISTSIETPRPRELSQVLREEFSNRYSYKTFGLESEKSIIVRKSILVGVQVTPRGNEIGVDFMIPSVAVSLFAVLIHFAGIFKIPSLEESWRDLEMEIAVFLRRKYA